MSVVIHIAMAIASAFSLTLLPGRRGSMRAMEMVDSDGTGADRHDQWDENPSAALPAFSIREER